MCAIVNNVYTANLSIGIVCAWPCYDACCVFTAHCSWSRKRSVIWSFSFRAYNTTVICYQRNLWYAEAKRNSKSSTKTTIWKQQLANTLVWWFHFLFSTQYESRALLSFLSGLLKYAQKENYTCLMKRTHIIIDHPHVSLFQFHMTSLKVPKIHSNTPPLDHCTLSLHLVPTLIL